MVKLLYRRRETAKSIDLLKFTETHVCDYDARGGLKSHLVDNEESGDLQEAEARAPYFSRADVNGCVPFFLNI